MKDSAANQLQYFIDLEASLALGKVQSDQRIQVKMPKQVVAQLDALFPNTDRSFILTQLAASAISSHMRFSDREILRDQKNSEQQGLNDMLTYLEDRDVGIL